MFKKYRLLDAEYDKEFGTSLVKIGTKLGVFEGFCMLDEEDKDIASEFFGCQIAEMRAVRKYFKQAIKIKKIEINYLKNLLKEAENFKKYKIKIAFLEYRLISEENQLNNLQEELNILNQAIPKLIKNYRPHKEQALKEIKKFKEKNLKNEDNTL